MATTYKIALDLGFSRPPRIGAWFNTWGAKINELAFKLDDYDLEPEVAELLRELFEEVGQISRDCWRA